MTNKTNKPLKCLRPKCHTPPPCVFQTTIKNIKNNTFCKAPNMVVARHDGLYHCDYLEKIPKCKYCLGSGVIYESYSPYNPEYTEEPPHHPCPHCNSNKENKDKI